MTDTSLAFVEAVRLHQQGDLAAARSAYSAVPQGDLAYADAQHLLGVLSLQEGNHSQAIAHIRVALDLGLTLPEAHLNLGTALKRADRFEEALAEFDVVRRLKPNSAYLLCNRAHCLVRLKRFKEALVDQDQALLLAGSPSALDYDLTAFHDDRGLALFGLDRYAEALSHFDAALALDSSSAELWSHRGDTLYELGDLEAALESLDRALELNPRHVLAYVSRGIVFADLLRTQESIASHERALELVPKLPTALFGAGIGYLRAGDYPRGWPLYESRFDLEDLRSASPYLRHPRRWSGKESLAGKRVVLWAEQGLGDTIQFCRYATLVAARGARVYLFVPESLIAVTSGIEGVYRATATIVQDYDFDYHCPLMSLPGIFGTTIDDVPFSQSAYLLADRDRYTHWSDVLGPQRKPRVGIVWSGGSASKIKGRSIPLVAFHVLLDRDLEFISLQKDVRDSDQAALGALPEIRHFGAQQRDFEDAAALIENVDVVVSVDTSLAHLAGAMAKETHVLLPTAADWRWLQDTDRSPWYASVQLHRRSAGETWEPVLRRVKRMLINRFVRPERFGRFN